MKKIIYLIALIVLLAPPLWAQEKTAAEGLYQLGTPFEGDVRFGYRWNMTSGNRQAGEYGYQHPSAAGSAVIEFDPLPTRMLLETYVLNSKDYFAEFDYSGTQACKALRKLGYEILLVNSNPATIMTDPGMADVTYIEPLSVEIVTKILAQERPDHPEASRDGHGPAGGESGQGGGDHPTMQAMQPAREGLVAVWGAKKLKAISVIGTGSVPVAHPAALLEARLWAKKNYSVNVDDPEKINEDQSLFGNVNVRSLSSFGSLPLPITFWQRRRHSRPQACVAARLAVARETTQGLATNRRAPNPCCTVTRISGRPAGSRPRFSPPSSNTSVVSKQP
jgi:hypothetical protein